MGESTGGGAADQERQEAALDSVDIYVRNKRGKRLRDTPSVLRGAVLLVWRSGPWLVTVVAGLTVLGALLTLGQLVVVTRLVGTLVSEPNGGGLGLVPWLSLLIVLTLTAQLAGNATTLLQGMLGQKALRQATSEVLEITSRVPLIAHEDATFHQHLQRAQQNGLTKPTEVVQGVVALVAGGVYTASLFAFIATVEPLLLPLLLITALPAYVTGKKNGALEFDFAVEQVVPARRRSYLGSMLAGSAFARELRAFETVDIFAGRWQGLWSHYLTAYGRLVKRKLRLLLLGTSASGVLTVLVGVFLAYRLEAGAIPVAAAGAAVVALRLLGLRAQETAKGVAALLEARLFLQDLESFKQTYGGASAQTAELGLTAPEVIELQDVSFRYPGASHESLHGISLVVRRGESIALVGENGSGKTTLSLVLACLHEATSGRVLWNGQELTADALSAARKHVGVVFQDFLRYEFSAADNVSLGHASDPARMSAALADGGAEFLEALPNGLATLLSKEYKGGQDVSVGQWQRIAVARAFHRDSPLVILDEPTSALDARAEAELFERLTSLRRGRTVVLVSHRLSSVRTADRILVLSRGEIVEQGTHEQLLAKGGEYAQLYALQAHGYQELDGGTAVTTAG